MIFKGIRFLNTTSCVVGHILLVNERSIECHFYQRESSIRTMYTGKQRGITKYGHHDGELICRAISRVTKWSRNDHAYLSRRES